MLVVALAGCEADGRKPMDEPLGVGDAFEADRRMRSDADALLREKAGDQPLPPRPIDSRPD